MDIKERLITNEGKLEIIQTRLKQLQNENQQLLQELLRIDGEQRLLLEMQKESE